MRGRKMLKAAALLIALGYCSHLAYQGGVTFNFQERQVPLPLVQVSELSIEPVTKTTVYESNRTKNIELDDIFISVKTTKHYQNTRLPIILKTWFQLAKEQTWFFTDFDNRQHQKETNGHMVNTNCSASHQRKHLCCKMSVEYDVFLRSGKKWFCHFDDDNYVNVPRLVSVLQTYNYQEDWYLGRTSIYEPLKINKKRDEHISWGTGYFWFATGGAGFCISRSLSLKMLPIASGGRFMSVCEAIRFPDDVSMGFIVELMLKQKLTLVPWFHSHLEQMKLLKSDTFRNQISFSYSKFRGQWNVIDVPGFDLLYDPTRFLSLHCFLYPHFKFCPRK